MLLPNPCRGSGYRSVQLMFLTCQPCGFRVCRSAITQKALFPCIPPALPLYLDMCYTVFSSGTAFHYPRDKLGCLPFDTKGIIFCTGLKSNHLPPPSIIWRQEGARQEVLSISCSVSIDKLAKCMQEGGSCNLHSPFLTASPISEQAGHTYLVTEFLKLEILTELLITLFCLLVF